MIEKGERPFNRADVMIGRLARHLKVGPEGLLGEWTWYGEAYGLDTRVVTASYSHEDLVADMVGVFEHDEEPNTAPGHFVMLINDTDSGGWTLRKR